VECVAWADICKACRGGNFDAVGGGRGELCYCKTQIQPTCLDWADPPFKMCEEPRPWSVSPNQGEDGYRGVIYPRKNECEWERRQESKASDRPRFCIIGKPLYRIVWLGHPSAYEEPQQEGSSFWVPFEALSRLSTNDRLSSARPSSLCIAS
jgi:hypothetical protein